MNRGRMNQGILLICIGLYFLLRNMGWIEHSITGALVANWPILLVFAGLYLLLGRTRLWFIPALLTVVLFLALIGRGPFILPGTHVNTDVDSFQVPVSSDVESIELVLDAAAADFTIQRGAAAAISGNVSYTGRAPETLHRVEDGRLRVELNDRPMVRRQWFDQWQPPIWHVSLPATLPTALKVNVSAGNLILDMRGIDSRTVDVATSAGNVHLLFDHAVHHAVVTLDAAASNVNITVPEGIGLRVQSSGALMLSNLKDLGFDRDGDSYVSPDYDQAEKKVDVHAKAAVGALQINRSRTT